MIPLADLEAQHAQLRPEIQAAIDRIFASSDFVQGQEVRHFEGEFAAYCGASQAVACGNGTDALELALWALGVGPGDEVITVSHTFAATAEAIARCGALPRFVDVDPESLLMDVTRLEAAITNRTRAIIPVHLYGSCVDMRAVMAIARRHGLKVIEDAAQAQGALSRGVKAGASADAGCFSFYPGKNLGACGDAGAVITSDPDLAGRMRQMRDHGRVGKYEHAFVGRNSRMDSLQGAVLRIKLRQLDRWNARRREIAGMYRALLAGLEDVTPVSVPPSSQPVYHQFVIRTQDRDALRQTLEARGIQTGIHYPIPLHRQPAFAAYVSRADAQALRETDAAAASILSLPVYPELRDRDVEYVGDAIAQSFERAADVVA